MSDSTDGTCHIRKCEQPARWLVQTKGHPNGDIEAWYCADHAKAYPWDESPTTYLTTIWGPCKKGRDALAKGYATAKTENPERQRS